MKKNNVLFFLMSLVVSLTMFTFTSCSSDDPDPDNGKTVDPGTKVDDPEGTIFLSMRNSDSGDTWLDGFHIKNENFEGAYFVSLGPVKGLGNVSYIPLKGWSNRVAVVEGNGYVAYYNGTFYRLYVVNEIVGTTGGVIGAEIKYQKPFKGSDENIGLDEKSLSFTSEGGEQSLVFNNTKLIQFTCESDQPWCHVYKSSTTEYGFLENAITVKVDPTISTESENATVTLTTVYGKSKTIQIARAGAQPMIQLGKQKFELDYQKQVVETKLLTNCYDNIIVVNNNDWFNVDIIDASAKMRQKASKIKFIDGKRVTARQEQSSANSYSVIISVSENGNEDRTGNVVFKTKDNKLSEEIIVEQKGKETIVELSMNERGVSQLEQQVTMAITTNCLDELVVNNGNKWVGAVIDKNSSSLVLNVSESSEEYARSGKIVVRTKDNRKSVSLTLIQEGANGFCPNDKHPHAIDLGTGVKFACCNVGASAPWEYGSYFAWGETGAKDTYSQGTYKFYKDGEYSNLGTDIAGTNYDVAHVLWKGSWKMPNQNQLSKLTSCSKKWTSMNGKNGMKLTGVNGISIFLPAAGYRWDDYTNGVGNHGYYWSSAQYPNYSRSAYNLYFFSGSAYTDNYSRYYGQSVRPVIE